MQKSTGFPALNCHALTGRMGKGTLTFLSVLTLSVGCLSYEVTVDSHLSNCVGLQEQTCMLLSDAPGAEQRLHYDGIVGFDYTWCNTHTLMVHDVPAAPAEDGSLFYPVLDSVVATESADGETFAMTLLSGWQPEVSDGFVPYHCAEGDEALCAGVHQALGEPVLVDGRLEVASVEAQFICEGGNTSPRLVSFESEDTTDDTSL